MPFFPLGGAFPGLPKVTDEPAVQAAARDLGRTPAQIGLAWLLHHAPNVHLIPGTAERRPPGGQHRRRRASSSTRDTLGRISTPSRSRSMDASLG